MIWNARAVVPLRDRQLITVAVPDGEARALELTLTPAFLPFVKLSSLELTFDEGSGGTVR